MAPPAFETQRLGASVAPPSAVSGGCRPHRRPPPRRPCLRRISAYSGGFRDHDAAVDSEAGASTMSAFNRGAVKKKLSFADQHDQELALEREFDQDEPVILMLIASRRLEAGGAQAADLSKMRPSPSKDAAALDRWLYGALTQQELFSLCVVSSVNCHMQHCAINASSMTTHLPVLSMEHAQVVNEATGVRTSGKLDSEAEKRNRRRRPVLKA